MRAKVMDALRGNFRPEFLNRIDETVIFTALTRDANRRNRRDPVGPHSNRDWRIAKSRS